VGKSYIWLSSILWFSRSTVIIRILVVKKPTVRYSPFCILILNQSFLLMGGDAILHHPGNSTLINYINKAFRNVRHLSILPTHDEKSQFYGHPYGKSMSCRNKSGASGPLRGPFLCPCTGEGYFQGRSSATSTG